MKIDIDVAALVVRLKKARCWDTRAGLCYTAYRYFDLDPLDVSMAVSVLEHLMKKDFSDAD